MANNNLQSTHENIHTGLSGLGDDSKWKDMLNFRSANRRTTVVPPKFVLRKGCCCDGLHTIVNGLDGHNFVFGRNKSFGFVGADNFHTYKLWRLTQQFLPALGNRDGQSQRLIVSGVFTGDRRTRIRVHYIDGKLIPDWSVVEPEPPAPEPPEVDYGCPTGDGTITVSGTITYELDDTPLEGVLVEFSRFGYSSYSAETNADGEFTIEDFLPGTYTYRVSKDGYGELSESVFIEETSTLDRQLGLFEPVVENIHAFLTVPSGEYNLSLFFNSPQLDTPVYPGQWWRLYTDDCGSQLEYARARVDSSGNLSFTDFTGPTTGSHLDQTTKKFVSTYAYVEGMYLQVGHIDPDTLIETWPTRPCIS